MHIEEQGRYRVVCYVERRDMRAHGIQLEDLLQRTPLGRMFIEKTASLCKQSTAYEWPGCGYSMQIDVYPDSVALVFSERIDDYLYNLKQSMAALPQEQAEQMDKMITKISRMDEKEARETLRKFEENIKELDR